MAGATCWLRIAAMAAVVFTARATPCGSLNRGTLITTDGTTTCHCDPHFRDGNFNPDQPDANREIAAFNIVKSGDNKCFTYSARDQIIVLSADCIGRGMLFTRTAEGNIKVVGGVPNNLLGGCLAPQRNIGSESFIGIVHCNAHNIINQFQIQTQPGLYQIRATGSDYWNQQCNRNRGSASGCQLINLGGTTFTPDGTRMLMYWGHGDQARIHFHVAAPVDQRCAVYDPTYNPNAPTIAPTAPTAAPSANPTRWFAHPNTQVTLNNLTNAVIQLSAQNQRLEAELRAKNAELEAAIAGNVSIIQSTLSERLNSLRDSIEGALSGLPEDGGDDGDNPETAGCNTNEDCAPVVEANGRNLEFRSPGGIVNLHTSNCGSFDPCDMLTALKDLRRSLIEETP